VVPFFSGERSTGYRTGATGAILGLSLQTRSEHLIKACLEGVTLRLNAIVQLICKVIVSSRSVGPTQQLPPVLSNHNNNSSRSSTHHHVGPMMIICSGQALERNELWRTMIADCTGLPVIMEKQTYEGTSRGVAILLRASLISEGSLLYPPATEWKNCGTTTTTTLVATEQKNVTYVLETIGDLRSTTQNMTSGSIPNEMARGYWDALSETQESIIDSISSTMHW
jgi:glycerol kinase